MPKWKHRLPREGLLLAAVLIVSLWTFSGAARTAHFYHDESTYLYMTRFFRYLFVEHELSRSRWGDNFFTHTQPMLSYYVLGAWLWSRGYDLKKMPQLYELDQTLEENRVQRRVPSDELLADARTPMAALAAGSVGLVYVVSRLLGGVIAGVVATALALGSPVVQQSLVRASPDSPLLFFVMLWLLVAAIGVRQGRRGGIQLAWSLASGILLGLAMSAKPTAIFSVIAVLIWGGLTVALSVRSSALSTARHRFDHAWVAVRGWALSLAIACGVFVLCNPHLYPDPLLHTAHLIESRREQFVSQQSAAPAHAAIFQASFLPPEAMSLPEALTNPLDRPRYVIGRSLIDYTATGSRGIPLEPFLALAGAAVLLFRIWRCRQEIELIAMEGVFMVTLLAYFAGVSASLLVTQTSYFAPTLLLGSVLSGLGAAAIARQLVLLRRGAVPLRARFITSARPEPVEGSS